VKITKNSSIPQAGRLAFLVLFCLGLWLAGQGTSQAQIGLVPSLDDATVEKYKGLQLVSRIHITRTFVDHEKWGFFKIGLAPIGVVEGIDVQVLSADSITNALYAINPGSISSAKLRRLEFRNLAISLLGEKEPRLRADSARIGQADILELSHVSVSNNGEAISIPKATLQVSGPNCGCLRWNDAGSQEQLFVLQPLKN
jgi:hypothetical protein